MEYLIAQLLEKAVLHGYRKKGADISVLLNSRDQDYDDYNATTDIHNDYYHTTDIVLNDLKGSKDYKLSLHRRRRHRHKARKLK